MGAPPLGWKKVRAGAWVEAELDAEWEGWALHGSHVGNPLPRDTGMRDVLVGASLLP